MSNQNFFMQFGNMMMKIILRSPLHTMVSGNVMLVTVKGRKSGKRYTTPVNYIQEGNWVYVTSQRERTWWRNLRGGAEATLRLRGQDIKATGQVVEDEQSVIAQLAAYLSKAPKVARYYGVSLNSEGNIDLEATAQAAKSRVCVTFEF